jgi:hypothetical protein
MTELTEPMPEVFTRSRWLILNFSDIPEDTPDVANIAVYFRDMQQQGSNPRLPEYRQAFNDCLLQETGDRYLVSNYAEDRSAMLQGSQIAAEGRTFHLGIDIFARDLDPVLAPCDGTIVRVGREPAAHSFGNYLMLRPATDGLPLLFFGHLSYDLPSLGVVKKGETISRLGDYKDNENGGWSRHLHLQCLKDLPPEGLAPIGYASRENLPEAEVLYPDPLRYFPDWVLR